MSDRPWQKTDAGRRYIASYNAKRRERWMRAGLCVDCGRARKWPTIRCEFHLIDGADR